MEQDLKDMLKISHGVGRDARLVQGGGGNTSVKTDGGGRMYIKASGTALGEMDENSGYREVDVQACIDILDDEDVAHMEPTEREEAVLQRLVEACVDDRPGRPSVETSLHAMLGRCVVHTHPSIVNGLLCAREGHEALEQLLAEMEPPFLYVEFVGAGYPLAVELQDRLSAYSEEHGCQPEVIFLENHGLFVATEDPDRGLERTREIFNAVEEAVQAVARETTLRMVSMLSEEGKTEMVAQVAAAMRRFYSELYGTPCLVRFDDGEVVQKFLELPQAPELAGVNPMTPDQVVYCKDSPVWLDPPAAPQEAQETTSAALLKRKNGEDTPLCLIADGLGVFSAAPTRRLLDAVSATMRASVETLYVAGHFGGARGLTEEWIQWMKEWEVERFRSEVARGKQASAELGGKVALVTGAGSGLGRGISLSLARKGVNVVLADIDLDSAEETEEMLEEEDAAGSGRPLRCDVTSEHQVEELLRNTVREFGGVDILVNCAGIAPAHPLTDFPLDEWRKTLEINLTGYFLTAREAARCMVRQRMGGAIINLSSKTGLSASKHNSAYNATKAGEIHLARGWALDLAEHGIRVNSVCPGNVFEGSKIWNQQYIEAVAEKRGIEPEEVIPYYVGLTALEEEITWEDVGEAVAFLAGGRAAKVTGQTLVVDAGQVFVR